MKKVVTERIMEIEGCNINEIDGDKINQAHQNTSDSLGYQGAYHLWLDFEGFCRGDVTANDIEADCKKFGVTTEDDLYDFLNDAFIEEFKEL